MLCALIATMYFHTGRLEYRRSWLTGVPVPETTTELVHSFCIRTITVHTEVG